MSKISELSPIIPPLLNESLVPVTQSGTTYRTPVSSFKDTILRTEEVFVGTCAENNTATPNSVIIGSYCNNGSEGSLAAGSCISGGCNISVGRYAGYSTVGYWNVSIGRFSGFRGTCSGSCNITSSVNIGEYAGYKHGGVCNVSIGSDAGASACGNHNISIGRRSGRSLKGNCNVSMGFYAGCGSSGSNNISIGEWTNVSRCVSNTLVLGRCAYADQDNQISLGSTTYPFLTASSGTANGVYLTLKLNGQDMKLALYD